MHVIVLVLMHIQQPDSKHRYRKDVERGECDGFTIGVDGSRAHAEGEHDEGHGPHNDGVNGELGVEPGRLGVLVLRAWACTMSVQRIKTRACLAVVDTCHLLFLPFTSSW